jgi:hypothetical protein
MFGINKEKGESGTGEAVEGADGERIIEQLPGGLGEQMLEALKDVRGRARKTIFAAVAASIALGSIGGKEVQAQEGGTAVGGGTSVLDQWDAVQGNIDQALKAAGNAGAKIEATVGLDGNMTFSTAEEASLTDEELASKHRLPLPEIPDRGGVELGEEQALETASSHDTPEGFSPDPTSLELSIPDAVKAYETISAEGKTMYSNATEELRDLIATVQSEKLVGESEEAWLERTGEALQQLKGFTESVNRQHLDFEMGEIKKLKEWNSQLERDARNDADNFERLQGMANKVAGEIRSIEQAGRDARSQASARLFGMIQDSGIQINRF